MSDEDTRSSGGGGPMLLEEEQSAPCIQTDAEVGEGSPCSGGGGSQRPASPVNGTSSGPRPLLDIHKGRPIRLQVRVLVPIKDHPNYNFVGKLLGPKGNSLKRLQEETQTKMAILGRGSMRDREREEELRAMGDPKHGHLHDDLHVEVTAFAPAAEAYGRMAHALAEVKRFLVPDYYDDIRQHQLRELAVLNGNRKRGGKGLPLDEDSQEAPLRPTFAPAQQQRLQVSMNGGSQQHGPPSQQQQQQAQPQGGSAPRPLRCGGLVSRAPLVGRAMRAAPRRHPPGLVRSFVTSVCAGSAGSLFREVTLAAPASGPEAARIQYLTEEDAFAFEEGFPCGGDPQRADEFTFRPSPAYVNHEYGDEASDAIYEAHNGYASAKDFIGEDWPQQSKGSPVPSSGAVTSGGRAGPSAGRLKGLGPNQVRPSRTLYREHPYFPAAVARY